MKNLNEPTRRHSGVDLLAISSNGHRDEYVALDREIAGLETHLADLREQRHQIMMDAIWQKVEARLDAKVGQDQREWLTLSEAADYLSVANSTIYSYIYQGLITRYGGPKAPRFRPDDLDAFLISRGEAAS